MTQKETLPAWASLALLVIAVIAFIANYEPAQIAITKIIASVVSALIFGIIFAFVLVLLVWLVYYLFFKDNQPYGI